MKQRWGGGAEEAVGAETSQKGTGLALGTPATAGRELEGIFEVLEQMDDVALPWERRMEFVALAP